MGGDRGCIWKRHGVLILCWWYLLNLFISFRFKDMPSFSSICGFFLSLPFLTHSVCWLRNEYQLKNFNHKSYVVRLYNINSNYDFFKTNLKLFSLGGYISKPLFLDRDWRGWAGVKGWGQLTEPKEIKSNKCVYVFPPWLQLVLWSKPGILGVVWIYSIFLNPIFFFLFLVS